MSSPADHLTPTVFIIEDDKDVRESLEGLFRSVGLSVELFNCTQDFLVSNRTGGPGCMVLDVRLPGKSGLDFYDDLLRAGINRPVVFISGHADVAMSVRAMKAGAVEFLAKPVRHQDLLDAVHLAIERDRVQRTRAQSVAEIRANFEGLTSREREIMTLVAMGRRSKEIASEVGVSEATVKVHRSHLMLKMRADSLVELVRMADALNICPPKP